jgi:hypothetical protein
MSVITNSNAAAWADGTLSIPCPKCAAKDADLAALKVKVERLRAALERIVLCKMDDDDKRYVDTLKTIAREAVKGKP